MGVATNRNVKVIRALAQKGQLSLWSEVRVVTSRA